MLDGSQPHVGLFLCLREHVVESLSGVMSRWEKHFRWLWSVLKVPEPRPRVAGTTPCRDCSCRLLQTVRSGSSRSQASQSGIDGLSGGLSKTSPCGVSALIDRSQVRRMQPGQPPSSLLDRLTLGVASWLRVGEAGATTPSLQLSPRIEPHEGAPRRHSGGRWTSSR